MKGVVDCFGIHTDNQGSITFAKNNMVNRRNQHIDGQYQFVRDAMETGKAKLLDCSTKEMNDCVLTKPLGRGLFEKIGNAIGFKSVQCVCCK